MKYELITLSPIHIGNGEQISNWSYAINANEIKIYSFEKVVNALKKDKQKLINLTATIERHPLDKTLGDIIKQYGLNVNPEYKVYFTGQIKKQRFDRNQRKNVLEYKQIWEFIKENGLVYIPGTEVKGAIRTALFYKILKDRFKEDEKIKIKFLSEYENCLNVSNFRDERDKKKQIQKNFSNLEKRWESIVFRAGFGKAFDRNFRFEDAKKDILKILLISDSDFKKPENVLQIKDITALGVSRHFEELHELIKPREKFLIDLKVPFEEEYKEIFPNTYKYLGLRKIREACSEFAVSIINSDIDYFSKTKELEDKSKLKLLDELKKRKELAEISVEKGWIVLRLGKHQGFLSTTINLLVKEIDEELYSKAYEFLVPKFSSSKIINKSRKITVDSELLGWCVLVPQK